MDEASREGDALHAAVERLKAGATAEAILQLQEFLREHPGDGRAHEYLGAAYGVSGDLAAAASHLELALSLSPNLSKAHYNLGVVYEKQGRFGDAMDHMQAAIRMNPGYEECRRHLMELRQAHPKAEVSPPAAPAAKPAESPPQIPRDKPEQPQPETVHEEAGPEDEEPDERTWRPGYVPPVTWDGTVASTGAGRVVLLAADGGWTGHYGVQSCPWWLQAGIMEGELYLTLANAGWRSGRIVLDHNGIPQPLKASALVLPSAGAAITGGLRGLVGGLAGSILGLIALAGAFGIAAGLDSAASSLTWLPAGQKALLAVGILAMFAVAGGVWGGMIGGTLLGRLAWRAMAVAGIILLPGISSGDMPVMVLLSAVAGAAFGLLVGDYGVALLTALLWPVLSFWLPGAADTVGIADLARSIAGPDNQALLTPAVMIAAASPLVFAIWGLVAGIAAAPCIPQNHH